VRGEAPGADAAELTVAVTRGEAAMRAAAVDWQNLLQRSPAATPFHTPEWALAGAGGRADASLLLFTVRRGEELVGLLPLRLRGWLGLRRAAEASGLADYAGPLVAPGCEAAVWSRLAPALAATAGWDLCDLTQLPHPPPAEFPGLRWEHEPCCVLALDPLPAPARRRLARATYYRRRLAREGFRCEPAPDVPAFLEDLFRLHGRRWRRRGLPGVFASARTRAFHLRLAPAMQEAGLLRAYRLASGSATVAAFYGFHLADRTYYYAGGFDPDHAERSPGSALLGYAVEAARAEGAVAFDFLRGSEPYKLAWGAAPVPTTRAVLTRGPAAASPRALRSAQSLEDVLKRAIRRPAQGSVRLPLR
jgi:CelD/BcsL family acetyltransferase involved in cellulose biosynthesis